MDEERHDSFRMIGELLNSKIQDSMEKGKELAQKKLPKAKQVAKIAAITCISLVVFSFILLAAGIMYESITLNTLSGVIRAFVLVIFFIVMAPFGVMTEFLKGGGWKSVKIYYNIALSCLVWSLLMPIILGFMPVKDNPGMILPFLVLSFAASFLMSRYLGRKIITGVVVGMFLFTIASFYFPYTFSAMSVKARKADQSAGMPIRLDEQMTCVGFKKETFFGPDSKASKYYCFNTRTHEIEVYELTSKSKIHPGTGVELKPMTEDVITALENQICRKENKARQTELDAKKAREDAEKQAKREADIAAREEAQKKLELANIESQQRDLERKEKEKAVHKEPPPVPKKPYRYAIVPGKETGNQGMQVCDELVKTYTSVFNAGWMSYQAAREKAERIIFVERIYNPPISERGDLKEARCVISIKIIESHTNKKLDEIDTADVPLAAFDASTAKKNAFDMAINSARVRLGKKL